MDYQLEANTFLNLIDNFLSLNQSTTNNSRVHTISDELTSFMRKPTSIDIILKLILTQGFPKDKLVMMTSLFKDKFKYQFQSIEQSKLPIYYTKLCEVGAIIPTCHHSAFTNISMTLAYIYINIASSWEQQILAYLTPLLPKKQQDFKIYNYYFKVLQYIASEIDNSRIVLDEESRCQAKRRALAQQFQILNNVSQHGQCVWNNPYVDRQNVLQSFTCWVDIGYNVQVLNNLPNHYLLGKMIQSLKQDTEVDSATECLKVIINLVRTPQQNAPIYQFLGQNVFDLVTVVERLIQQGNFPQAEQYLTIVLDFSRKSTPLLIRTFSSTAAIYLSKIIQFMKQDSFGNYENVVHFWEIFLDEAIIQLPTLAVSSLLFDLVHDLYDAVTHRCRFSINMIMQLENVYECKMAQENAEADQIIQHRQQSISVFQKMSKLEGKLQYLSFVARKIQTVSCLNQFWSWLQVYLFSLITPLRKLQAINSDVILLINSFSQINQGNKNPPIAVQRAFLKVFKTLMTVTDKNISFIQKLFYYTSTCFTSPLLMDAAERTFAKGCQQNSEAMQSSIEEMLKMLELYPTHNHIARGVVVLICSREDFVPKYLPSLFIFLYQAIIHPETNKQRRKECMHSLIGVMKILKETPMIQRHLQILHNFTKHIWQWLMFSLLNPQSLKDDEDPQIQRIVKLLKYLMRCLGFLFSEFVSDLYTRLIQSYKCYPICSYVYLVEVAITVFYGQQKYTQFFRQLYNRFCEITYQHLNNIEKIQRYQFLLDDFIGMNKRFFIFNTNIVITAGQLPQLLELCISAFMNSNTPRVAKASYTFFETIFMVYWRQQLIDKFNAETEGDRFNVDKKNYLYYFQLKKFLLEKVQYVIIKMLEHLSEIPLEITKDCIIESLLAELSAFPQENSYIWSQVLSKLPHDILLQNEKERFKEHIEHFKSENYDQALQSINGFKRYLSLINRRMVNASKRKKLI